MHNATIGCGALMLGGKVGGQMGVTSWAAVAGADDDASVDGEFAMIRDELQGVPKALRRAGIDIVAIHDPTTHEDPKYAFPHHWGKRPAPMLAKEPESALETQGQQGVNP